ncbi:MAG TPA: AAA family ATPase [Candidatus Absconditabacterales bacterium]|nr:AAA family ATPase [Candidatus Absconditabacterales bacterium]HNG96891.1 AAA family ATPase [Candidatus Absconditabacterales bacterium]
MYLRTIYSSITNALFKGKAVIVYGARQVGKTTLCHAITKNYEHVLYLNGDDPYTQQLLINKSISDYQ